LGADVFYDAPVGTKGSSVSIYGLFQNMNYGEKYLRNIGILNTAPTVGTATQLGADAANASVYGGGNLQPTIGTGNIFYLQAGYKLPKMNNGAAIMPYATYTFKNFQAIGASSSQVSLGANYFVSDHNCKITAEYGIHPVYKADASKSTGVTQNGFKGQFTIQTHIFL
jgi:hypothetical protein